MLEHVIAYSVVEDPEMEAPTRKYLCFIHAVARALYAPVRDIRTEVIHTGHYNLHMYDCRECALYKEGSDE